MRIVLKRSIKDFKKIPVVLKFMSKSFEKSFAKHIVKGETHSKLSGRAGSANDSRLNVGMELINIKYF